ncbi:4-alpha-glucanotransferase [Micromonospora sp. LAH09]|uniref:4-alpha-glucanotransferase n=1 Tax=Micromonospora cabrerizensis TaxID=2911213 RepID=UPI001EE8E5F6|nr:4-alpha-glucanotransferase [Micromonospora cabrerizensis]MCG5471427.1 4-alpha-glucanotransferase [Micromonospora cabrerizensis]
MNRRLAALANAHGVSTWYEDWRHRRVEVAPDTVVGVLGLLGVDATSPAAIADALTAARAVDRGALPETVVLAHGTTRGLPGPGVVTLEDGGRRAVDSELPGDLPLGWHRLACAGREATLVVVPRRLPVPPHTWGWMLQLYALTSDRSWGMGDLGDLAEFTGWAGDTGAGLVLLNPLHAVGPAHPVAASPYSPASRRFVNPLYLRVSDTAAYRAADPATRAVVDALRPDRGDLIDYDQVWTAKRHALELLHPYAQPVDLAADPALASFATWCALAERHGNDWRAWPRELHHPDAPAVAEQRRQLADRVAFHAWLQHLCDEQLDAVTAAARAAGMPVGVVHDLAVGIDPGGADGWQLADVLAQGVRVGAPPDDFNQLGQDWGLAAWRPDRLAATGYAAYRDMLRRTLRHAGGLRVDHVAGLWRLWWVPPGAGAAEGTYVRYDAEAMLGILALEAHRAGAVVVGEDLGTVQPAVTRGLRGRNMLGSTVLWFARDDDGGFVPPARWPRNALATISTHDLPTAPGFLNGEHVRVRDELKLLGTDVAVEQARAATDRERLLDMLRAERLLPEPAAEPGPGAAPPPTTPGGAAPGPAATPDDGEVVVAMHAALAASPTRLLGVSLYDVLGEVRQPNMPGTVDEYPNWRLPLPNTVAEIRSHPRVTRIVDLLTAARPRRVDPAPTEE